MPCAEKLSVCFLKTPGSVSCLFIPSAEICNFCTNSIFSHMSSALLVWNKACSFPLLHLPVQMKGSMPCGCSWKGKLMFIQLFTLPQKPHLTSEKSLFPPPAPLPRVHRECLTCSYLVGILIQYCSDWRGSEYPEEEESMQRGGEKRLEGRKYSDVMVQKPWSPRRSIADNRECIKAIITSVMEPDTKMCSSTIACKITSCSLLQADNLAWKTASVRASVMKPEEKVIWS